jgi:hypothetical protein
MAKTFSTGRSFDSLDLAALWPAVAQVAAFPLSEVARGRSDAANCQDQGLPSSIERGGHI